MIPQLAHHPRYLSEQRFGGPDFAIPPFQSRALPLPSQRRLESPAPLPVRSLQEFISPAISTPSPRTYALDSYVPRRAGLARESSSEQTFRSPYNDPSEHMLRRKTPNGTLAAGYDGTPVQWSSKAPALKHVVLPLSGAQSSRNLSYSPASGEQYQRIRPSVPSWSNEIAHIRYRGLSLQGEQRGSRDHEHRAGYSIDPINVYGGWDNIRMPPSHTYYSENTTRVPTVLQPAYQASPGPTASNDGPYWPDGRFVPYRPAAFQGQGGHNQELYSRSGFQDAGHPSSPFSPTRAMPSNLGANRRASGTPYSNHSDSQKVPLDTRYDVYSHFPTDSAFYSSMAEGSRTPSAESTNRASSYRFREKTLSWAHTIYVDLLAFLHQSKKEAKLLNPSQGSKPYSKTSIYPKPPRQPAPYPGVSHSARLSSKVGEYNNVRSDMSGGLRAPQTAPLAPNYDVWQNTEARDPLKPPTFHESYTHHVQIPQYPRVSPAAKAKEALELLTNLCEQSGWNWIDGMLLGGCLAYGLEQYESALDWYSKIIALDSK
jgi:hypothetical protein